MRTLRATLTATGAHLSAMRAASGQYAIMVSDRSNLRGFRLDGPGVSRRTTKAFVGTTTWRVALRPWHLPVRHRPSAYRPACC